MKKVLFILLAALIALPAVAQTFSYKYEGQTLKYTVLDEDARTVAVSCNTTGIEGEVVIPSVAKDGETEYTVTELAEKAFFYCWSLTEVEIPNSITSIGDWAFYDCKSLTTIEIPNSVSTIKENVLRFCRSLETVKFPASVTTIGERPFTGCTSLKDILVDDQNMFYSSIEGVLFNKDKSILICYPQGKIETKYTIPSSVKIIEQGAFCLCELLKTITIPNSVISIGEGAFAGCYSITSVTIPYSVTTIGNFAFASSSINEILVDEANSTFSSNEGVLFNKDESILICFPRGKKETDYSIPSSVSVIGDNAFSGCYKLYSVSIPNSVTEIGERAFELCELLTSITIPNSVEIIRSGAFFGCGSLTSATLPKSITTIEAQTFTGCGLESITIPNSVTAIGTSAFNGCSLLTTVIIPNSVEKIGSHAFGLCRSLSSLTLSSSLTTIGIGAFSFCYSLSSIYYDAKEPIEGNVNIFSDKTYQSATLYISKMGYRLAHSIDPWMNFEKIKVYDFEASIEDIVADGNAPCEVYNLQGVKVAASTDNLPTGIYVVRQGSNVTKIAVN